MNPHYEEQKDEVDLLENILFDKLKIVQDLPTFSLERTITATIDEPKMEFLLIVDLPEDYPMVSPSFTLTEENNYLATAKLRTLQQKLSEICNDYLGMTVVYQLYEAVQTFASDEEEAIINDEKMTQIKIEEEKKAIEEQKRIEEEKLLESKTFTPVTKDLFDEWYKKFLKKVRGDKTKTENDGRLTGREFFMNKNIKIEDNEEEIEREKEDGNNKFNGNGHYKWKNGHEYIGEYHNGILHGKGLYKWSEKGYYKGDYNNGVKEGNGEIKYEDGKKFICPFVKGKPNGIGMYEDGKGNKTQVELIDGKINKKFKPSKKNLRVS